MLGQKWNTLFQPIRGKDPRLFLKTQANLWQQEFALVLDNLCVKDLVMDTMLVSSAASALTKTVSSVIEKTGLKKSCIELKCFNPLLKNIHFKMTAFSCWLFLPKVPS